MGCAPSSNNINYGKFNIAYLFLKHCFAYFFLKYCFAKDVRIIFASLSIQSILYLGNCSNIHNLATLLRADKTGTCTHELNLPDVQLYICCCLYCVYMCDSNKTVLII